MAQTFWDAAYGGDLERVKELLAQGADVNEKAGPYGDTTALQQAAVKGHLDIVKELIEHGADVNMRKKCGDTALHCSVYSCDLECLKELLLHGIDANAKTTFRHTAFDLAEDQNLTEIMEELNLYSEIGAAKYKALKMPKVERPLQLIAEKHGESLTIMCSNLGGDVLAKLADIDEKTAFSVFIALLHAKLPTPSNTTWKLVMPDESCPDEADPDVQARPIYEFFEILPFREEVPIFFSYIANNYWHEACDMLDVNPNLVNATMEGTLPALSQAAVLGDLVIVQRLLVGRADPLQTNAEDMLPWQLARGSVMDVLRTAAEARHA